MANTKRCLSSSESVPQKESHQSNTSMGFDTRACTEYG